MVEYKEYENINHGVFRSCTCILNSISGFSSKWLCVMVVFFFFLSTLQAQEIDILLKGGHVIDPKNEINGPMDIAVKASSIARVAADIPVEDARRVIDVTGYFVTPGLIDLHTHIFFGTDPYSDQMNSYRSVKPDNFSFKYGVTTMVDAGSSGWRNFHLFKDQTIAHSRTRILAFLRIVGYGSRGTIPFDLNLDDMNPEVSALVARQHPEIVGFKIAHYRGNNWEPYRRLVEAGRAADLPVKIDFGGAEPALSLYTLLMEILRPGDIYTHIYGGGQTVHGDRESVIDNNGILRDGMLEAQERGIIYDIGHGSGSFFYNVALPALDQGLMPNTISSDLHQGSANSSMQNILNVMSKLLNIGMSTQEVIQATTWIPAKVIRRNELGNLSVGAEADIAVLSLLEGDFGFVDSDGFKIMGTKKFEAELTLRAGDIVWDLNGISAEMWHE